MRIDLLSDLLAERGIGVVGKSIFEDSMPSDVKVGVLLKLPLQGIPIDHELPGYFRGAVQVIVRAQKVETGDTLARRVSSALTLAEYSFKDGQGREVMLVKFLRPRTLPIVFPRSDGNGKEWSINLDAAYVLR